MKWAELLDKDIPQELQKDIQSQMEACNAIIASKDELITDFQTQLRGKDEEYVRTLRQQSEDIDVLISRIRKEFKVTKRLSSHSNGNILNYCMYCRSYKASTRKSWTPSKKLTRKREIASSEKTLARSTVCSNIEEIKKCTTKKRSRRAKSSINER